MWLGVVAALLAGRAAAGGGVMLDNDRCVITIGFYEAHFTAYQPGTRGDEAFCEDLPEVGESVFVLDYLHEAMSRVPVDFRIIRDPTGLGRFVRGEDLEGLDLEAHTVYYHPPVVEADASFRVSHDFAEAGRYVGIVTAGHPSKRETYTSVFPFAVGGGGLPWLWMLAGAAVAGCAAVLALLLVRGAR
ncbi:MAG: hypothetical protein ACODAC_05240 [Pseudomonadota bacterium]